MPWFGAFPHALLEREASPMAEGFRITYATMSADNEELHKDYDEAIEQATSELGRTVPVVVNGEERLGEGTYELRSPIDGTLLANISQATRQDVMDAVAAAKAFAIEWDRMGWKKHVEIIENAADIITERRSLLAVLMAMEVGKNRLEALGDVEETADLMRWNAREMVEHDGFTVPMQAMGASGQYYDV
jgi:1-pyrroline-5-carboxylate dehydrogenase